MPTVRLAATIAALGVVTALVAGCASSSGSSTDFGGIYDLPLPGGADLGSHPYQVTAQFTDVLDLVPQAAVKVNDVAVGRVASITLPADGWTANVTMLINGDVHLPANATAYLEQTSLLGEKYIELAPPTGATAEGTLANDATIPLSRTNRNPEVEEVFGALSMLLNGGGIGQLQTIDKQLNDALSGNEPQIRAMLGSIDTLVSNLNDHRQDITQALDGINQLSASLANRDQQIGNVLDNLTPGLRILDQQRDQLVTMLNSLNTLSGVAVDTIRKSKDDMVADLQALAPTLRQLANAGSALPQALQVLITYPFTDAVLAGTKGDYLNLYVSIVSRSTVDAMMPEYPPIAGTSAGAGTPAVPNPTTTNGAPPLPLPSVSGSMSMVPTTDPGSTSSNPPTTSPTSPTSSAPPPGSSIPPSGTGGGSPSSTASTNPPPDPSSTQQSGGGS
ncbi:MAG TPA: MCE family protein [Pseudonocardiaceae bacterium]|jgi:phospholipid/cholesterol/gamma-HCH transport system substrate-binding protein|nr:MCE family protein [Pseudonocardiaceae bacterium]